MIHFASKLTGESKICTEGRYCGEFWSDDASKALAFAGFHPYNPLTGIILSRRLSIGGRVSFGLVTDVLLDGTSPTPVAVAGRDVKTPASPKS
jgi:hypothetical protein